MSSELYRRLVESSADGLWVLDNAGRTVFANPRLEEMLGVPRDDMIGRDHADFLDDVGRRQWQEHIRTLDDRGVAPLPVECRFVRSDGVAVWFLVTEARLLDDRGEPSGVLLSLSEFDDRRRLASELEAGRLALLEAQRIGRIGSWRWSAETDLVDVSPHVLEMVGIRAQGFPMPLGRSMSVLSPEQRSRLEAAGRPLLNGEADAVTLDLQAGAVSEPLWLRVRGVASRDPSGALLGVSGTLQDVTDSWYAEESLRELVQEKQLMQGIAAAANRSHTLGEVLTACGPLVVGHENWARARTFEPDPELTEWPLSFGTPDAELADPGVPDREVVTARRALAEGGPVWDDEVGLTVACPVSVAGEPVAVIAMTSDPPLADHARIIDMVRQVAVQLSAVAERQATALELAAARDAAMEASRQKSEFLATMSHEIRTPLNGVIGLNDLLRGTVLDPHQERLASGVAVSGRALLGIVDDILDFSKIEAGLLELEAIDLDLRQVLDDVAAMTAESAAARGVELVMHCDRDVPELLRGDRVRLTQVVSNLVSNAVKFSQDGDVVVRAVMVDHPDADPGPPSGRAPDREGLLLRVEVADTGVGIPPERTEGIFEPFIQADASTTREYGGTGLGLAIVREIVTALGGEVGVRSEPGRGSTFWFTARLRGPAGRDGPDGAPDRTAVPLSGRRVLLVDGHAARRAADTESLAHRGADVVAVAPDEAFPAWQRAVREGRPVDAVLLDRQSAPTAALTADIVGVPVIHVYGVAGVPAGATGELVLERPVSGSRLCEMLVAAMQGTSAPASVPAEPVHLASSGTSTAVTPGTGRGRVLVVEDTPINQMVAEGILAALGYESESVEDGIHALHRLEHGATFDLVLMDVQMPRMDGYATARAIRRRERDGWTGDRLPIVAMTAAAVTGERERCLEAGMDDFLTKPVSPARLATVLADHLPGGRSARPGPFEDGAVSVPEAGTAGLPAEVREHLDLDRLDMLRDLDPGNTGYLDRVIGNFVARTPGLAAAVSDAVAEADPATVVASAHRLRGSALNLGVPQAADAALALELLGESGDLAGAGELLAHLEESLEQGRSAVVAYRRAYQDS